MSDLLEVHIREAQPNKLFTEQQRAGIRFLQYNRSVACAECGKKRKVLWTCLYEFLAHDMGQFTLRRSGLVHPPLEGVCGDHLLAPALPEEGE
jgi:hypothetical protein